MPRYVHELQVLQDDRTGAPEIVRSELFDHYWDAVRWAEKDRADQAVNPHSLGRFYRVNLRTVHDDKTIGPDRAPETAGSPTTAPAPEKSRPLAEKSQRAPTPAQTRSRSTRAPKGRAARK